MRDSLKWIVTIFFVISFVFGIVGCKEPEIQVDTSVNYGSIKGKVLYSNENVNNHSGIQITLVSTDGLMTTEYSSSRGIATKARSVKDIRTSNISGEYSFENIPVGVYTIYASSNSSLEKAVATNIVVKGKQTVIANDLNLTATGSVRGYVSIIGSAGNTESPLGLDVFIAGTSFDGKVGLDGCFELTGIPAKTGYVLCVQKGDYVKIVDDNLEIISNYTVDVSHIYLSENDLKEGMMQWLGVYDSWPENPRLYDAFFNLTDGCSYIWNGNNWDLLAQGGKDGKDGNSINWLGGYYDNNDISDPQYLDAYYSYTDGCSYIWNGYSWDLLSKDGQGINWLGSYYDASEIVNPQYLDAYYNYTDGCSYIWNGDSWDLLSKDGQGINWLGSYVSPYEIYDPQYLDAYFNTTDGCSYIFTNNGWKLLAQKGQGINWLGSYSGTDEFYDPQYLDAYYDTSDGCSYIYTANGWTLFAKAGTDGKNIVWRGNFEDANLIENPQELDAYFNTTDGCSYIYTNNDWKLLAQAGANGKSIVWIGSYPNADDIEEPQLLWAYYNITDGCSYIYDGSKWQLLARKGTDGATGSGDGSIRWRGTFANANEVYEPAPLDAFFNTTDGCSYIYNGTNWVMLARAGEDGKDGTDGTNGANGKDGEDGKGINWRGSYSTGNDISSPKYLDAYWNTTENCAYVYNGSEWTVLIKGPASGGTGSSSNTNIGSELGANVVGTTLISWDSTLATGEIRIPNGVTDIAEEVFYNNDKITRVIIPSTVVNIGYRAFYGCDNITSVEFLGNGLEIISEGAFEGCGNLVNFTLPSSLKIIGEKAFYGCKKITTVNIPDNVTSVGSSAFNGCWMLRTLTIGSGVTNLEEYTFCDCDALTSVIIQNTVKTISVRLFVGCDSLVELVIDGTWCINNGEAQKISIADLKRDTYSDGYYDYTWTRVTE